MNSNFPSIRFSEFKSSWEIRQIGDLLVDVSRPIKMEDDQIYQLVTVKRRNAGIVSRGYFKGADVLVKSQFIVQAGDYLISKRQIVHGANGIVPEHLSDSIVSNEYLILHGTNELNVEYLSIISKLPSMYKMFYLSSYGVDIEKLVFNVSDWKKRELAIPSIEEQAKITLFFNELNKLISLHQQELEALKQTKQGFLQKMFPKDKETAPAVRFEKYTENWQLKKLGDILKVNSGRDYKHLRTGNIPVYGTGGFMLNVNESLSNEDAIGLGRKGTIDKPQLLKAPFWTVDTLFFMTMKKDIDLHFSYSLINMIPWKKYDESTGVPSLSKTNIDKILVKIPSYEEQVKIGEFFRQLDEVIELKEKELDALKETKKGFLQKMFV